MKLIGSCFHILCFLGFLYFLGFLDYLRFLGFLDFLDFLGNVGCRSPEMDGRYLHWGKEMTKTAQKNKKGQGD